MLPTGRLRVAFKVPCDPAHFQYTISLRQSTGTVAVTMLAQGSKPEIIHETAAELRGTNRFLVCREFHRLSAALLTYLVLIVAWARLYL